MKYNCDRLDKCLVKAWVNGALVMIARNGEAFGLIRDRIPAYDIPTNGGVSWLHCFPDVLSFSTSEYSIRRGGMFKEGTTNEI